MKHIKPVGLVRELITGHHEQLLKNAAK